MVSYRRQEYQEAIDELFRIRERLEALEQELDMEKDIDVEDAAHRMNDLHKRFIFARLKARRTSGYETVHPHFGGSKNQELEDLASGISDLALTVFQKLRQRSE